MDLWYQGKQYWDDVQFALLGTGRQFSGGLKERDDFGTGWSEGRLW